MVTSQSQRWTRNKQLNSYIVKKRESVDLLSQNQKLLTRLNAIASKKPLVIENEQNNIVYRKNRIKQKIHKAI